MRRLNALEWADGLCFSAFGVRVGIRVTVPQILPALVEFLPPGWKPASTRKVQWLYSMASVPSRRRPERLIHTIYTGRFHLTQGSDLERIRQAFARDLQVLLAIQSPWRTFVHSGAVGWRGRVILLPGEGGSGKSTLTRALVQAGATYYSDEFAVLDRKGWAHPYPLPLREKKAKGPGSRAVPLEDLGGVAGERPRPVGLILSTRFDPRGPGRWSSLSHGRGALELVAHAVQARTRPDRVMETAGKAAEGAIILKGPRGEAEKTVDRILGLW